MRAGPAPLPKLAERQPSGVAPDDFPWIDGGREGPRLLFVDGRLDESRSTLGPVEIGPVVLLEKTGGKGGPWSRG